MSGKLAKNGRQGGTAALVVIGVIALFQLVLSNPEPTPADAAAPGSTSDAGRASTATATSARAAGSSAALPATTATTAAAGPAPPSTTTTATATMTTRPVARPADPRVVAVRWYAARHHLDPSKVKALQADQLSRSKVRVLLLVTKPDGRLTSAVLTVVKDGQGWKVRP